MDRLVFGTSAIKITSLLVLSALLCVSIIVPVGSSAPSDAIDEPQPILVTDEGDKCLYRLDLNDGPLYYYVIQTDHGTITKVVAIATMTLNVTVG